MSRTRRYRNCRKRNKSRRRRRKTRRKKGGRIFQRKQSIMRRRRKHIMIGGGHYAIGGAGVQHIPMAGNFSSGFAAGYSSCVPQQHFIGYTHPI